MEEAISIGDGPGEWEAMALAICHKIESMGRSEELTNLSVMASGLYRSIAAFNKHCHDSFEKMCADNPDLEPILRGKTGANEVGNTAVRR